MILRPRRFPGEAFASDLLPMGNTAQRFPEIETEPEELEILPDTKPIVADLFEPGDKVIIASGSKSYKTWTLIQMGQCIASGVPWLGFTTQRSRVLYLNF